MSRDDSRARLRDLGILIGRFNTGKFNAITDVPGVLVGHKTVIRDEPVIIRTGVTVILPRGGKVHEDALFAGFFSFNGIGEMTGIHLIEEWGLLTTPVVMTNTNQVGMAWDTISRYGAEHFGGFAYKLPVVAETYDGYLNDMDAFPLTPADVIDALESAASGPVEEGNVGGGTGMICYGFKGGIGTSSRIVEAAGKSYTVGAIVQANHGSRHQLLVSGVPVGRKLDHNHIPDPSHPNSGDTGAQDLNIESSSILVIIATDVPLLPIQCKRLARRAAVGLARTGGVGNNTSGDLFLAFSTGNHYDHAAQGSIHIEMLHNHQMDSFIEATAEAVEESILNALTSARTMTGYLGRTVNAIPLDVMAALVNSGA